jgi:hypothetical protein
MPISSSTVSFNDIQTEFGGANPISIDEYYNISGKYCLGVTGIPTSGQISINNFRGKSKIQSVPVSSGIPTSVQTNYSGTFAAIPWGLGNTAFEALSGVSGINLTRNDVSTFNNLYTQGLNRPNFINYQNLILQAKPNDTIRLNAHFSASGSYSEFLTAFINFGYGYSSLGTQGIYSNSGTAQWDYVIPSGTPSGNYGLLFYNNYGAAGDSSYASANFYSLHIFN